MAEDSDNGSSYSPASSTPVKGATGFESSKVPDAALSYQENDLLHRDGINIETDKKEVPQNIVDLLVGITPDKLMDAIIGAAGTVVYTGWTESTAAVNRAGKSLLGIEVPKNIPPAKDNGREVT